MEIVVWYDSSSRHSKNAGVWVDEWNYLAFERNPHTHSMTKHAFSKIHITLCVFLSLLLGDDLLWCFVWMCLEFSVIASRIVLCIWIVRTTYFLLFMKLKQVFGGDEELNYSMHITHSFIANMHIIYMEQSSSVDRLDLICYIWFT